MPNLHRGEIEAILDGCPHTLCLTLGALAELEAVFGDEDILSLAERLGRGKLSARDATRIIGAGLRGAGLDIADDAVARMRGEGGAAGFVDVVARLLGATFGASDAPQAGAPLGNASANTSHTSAVTDASSALAAALVDALPKETVSHATHATPSSAASIAGVASAARMSSSPASHTAAPATAREVRSDTGPFPGTR